MKKLTLLLLLMTQIQLNAQENAALVFLGASITSGFGLPSSQAFPALIQRKIDANHQPYRVINRATPGAATQQWASQMTGLLGGETSIHTVVIGLGLSDAMYQTKPERIKDNLRALILAIRKNDAETKIFLYQAKIFQHVVSSRVPALGSDYDRAYQELFQDLAQEQELILLPFMLERVAGVDSLNQADRIHPNAKGASMIAEALWNYLEKEL